MKNNTIKSRKGEFLVRTWVMAILIFSAVFALLFLASSDLITNYGEETIIDNDYRANYDSFTNTSEDYRGLFTDMSDGSIGVLDVIFGETGVFRALFTTIKITFSSISIVDDTTSQFVQDFGVPEGIANVIFPLFSALLMVFLIFAIISSVNRGSKL